MGDGNGGSNGGKEVSGSIDSSGFDFGFWFLGNIFDFEEVFYIFYSYLSKGIFDFLFHFFQFDLYFLCWLSKNPYRRTNAFNRANYEH